MKVALPIFGSQISPRFDCASQIMLVDIESGNEKQRQQLSLQSIHPNARANFLRANQVQVLLCGGLRRRELIDLSDSGIEVIAGLFGEVEEVLQAYREGRLRAQLPPASQFCGARTRHRTGNGCAGRGRGRMNQN